MNNYYLDAIYAETEEEQFRAFRQFIEQEMEACLDRMPDGEFGDLTDDQRSKWEYEKGRLDCLRTMHGLILQAMLVREMNPDVRDA